MASSESGRIIVLAIAMIAIGISAVVITIFVAANGSVTLPPRLLRFALTVALGVFLYRGAAWARWTAVVLFSIASALFVPTTMHSVTSGRTAAGYAFMGMALFYGASAVTLVFVPSVRAHFKRSSNPTV